MKEKKEHSTTIYPLCHPLEQEMREPTNGDPSKEGNKGGVVTLDSTQKEAFVEHLLRSEFPTRWKA